MTRLNRTVFVIFGLLLSSTLVSQTNKKIEEIKKESRHHQLISTKTDTENIEKISPEAFIRIYEKTLESDYTQFLQDIKKNNIDSVSAYLNINTKSQTFRTLSFQIDSIKKLEEYLDITWANTSKKTLYPNKFEVQTYDPKNFNYKTYRRTNNINQNKILDEFYAYDKAVDRTEIKLDSFHILGFHSEIISIFIMEDVASISFSNSLENQILDNYNTPLSLAFFNDHKDIFLKLTEAGYTIDQDNIVLCLSIILEQDSDYFTSALNNQEGFKNMNYKGNGIIHSVAKYGNTEQLSLLLKKGFKLETPNDQGEYPIHIAAMHNPDMIDFIYNQDPRQLEIKNSIGNTPLHYACISEHLNLTKVLKYPLDIDTRNNQGTTALMYASELGSLKNVKSLIQKNPKTSLLDDQGLNACHYAIRGRQCETLKYFIKNHLCDTKFESLAELRTYSKENKYRCNKTLSNTRPFHMEGKFQLNLSKINYEQATYLISGGYGIEFSHRIFDYADINYCLSRLYIESGIRNTDELSALEISDEHYGSYETNFFSNILSIRLYPVHYINNNMPFIRFGYDFRIIKEAGLLGGTSQIMNDLSNIAPDFFNAALVGIGWKLNHGFSSEITYSHGLTDANSVFPGSYNTFALQIGFGF